MTSSFGTDPLAHVIPDDPAPYAEVVINNLGGNKMDYYLDREIEYVADGCDGDTRLSTVTVRLTNRVADPTGLPDYVAGKLGFVPSLAENIPRGAMLTSVRLLATKGRADHQRPRQWQRIRVYGERSAAIQVSKLRLRSILGRLLKWYSGSRSRRHRAKRGHLFNH